MKLYAIELLTTRGKPYARRQWADTGKSRPEYCPRGVLTPEEAFGIGDLWRPYRIVVFEETGEIIPGKGSD